MSAGGGAFFSYLDLSFSESIAVTIPSDTICMRKLTLTLARPRSHPPAHRSAVTRRRGRAAGSSSPGRSVRPTSRTRAPSRADPHRTLRHRRFHFPLFWCPRYGRSWGAGKARRKKLIEEVEVPPKGMLKREGEAKNVRAKAKTNANVNGILKSAFPPAKDAGLRPGRGSISPSPCRC